MPEGGRHAPILIAISWQALKRAERPEPDTLACDCTVVILFAGLYVEASLNHVIRHFRQRRRLTEFLNNKPYPGLNDKLMWFYNDYIAPSKLTKLTKSDKRRCAKAVRHCFPGLADLSRVRNDLAHGRVNRIARSLEQTRRLRQQAKDIVTTIRETLRLRGHRIRRLTDYYTALQKL